MSRISLRLMGHHGPWDMATWQHGGRRQAVACVGRAVAAGGMELIVCFYQLQAHRLIGCWITPEQAWTVDMGPV